MQQVDLYIRNAREARELAKVSPWPDARDQFEAIAEAWKRLANERLSFLQQKLTSGENPSRLASGHDGSGATH